MASQPPFSSPVRVRLEFLDGSSTPQVVSAAQPLPVTGGGGGGGGGGGAVTAAAGSYVAGAIVDLGTGASPAANTVNANLVAIRTTLGSPFQAGGSVSVSSFPARGAGSLTTVPAATTNGTALGALPAGATGVRFYLAQTDSVTFTIATSAPSSAPGVTFTLTGGVTGPNWDESLTGTTMIYVTALTGSPKFRWL